MWNCCWQPNETYFLEMKTKAGNLHKLFEIDHKIISNECGMLVKGLTTSSHNLKAMYFWRTYKQVKSLICGNHCYVSISYSTFFSLYLMKENECLCSLLLKQTCSEFTSPVVKLNFVPCMCRWIHRANW